MHFKKQTAILINRESSMNQLKKIRINYSVILIFMTLFVTGCTVVPRDGDFNEVESMANQRIPQRVHWYKGGEEDSQVNLSFDNLLQEPLTSGSAVQIALLNNRRLHSEYEDLGIANPLGVNQFGMAEKAAKGGMGDMGGMHKGMHHGAGFEGPRNTLPMMTGEGPFGSIEMGGMFTVVKIRDGKVKEKDKGWYGQPSLHGC